MVVDTIFERVHIQKRYTHAVDMVREFSPLILVNGMADIRGGTLHGDPASLDGDGGSPRAEFDIKLSHGGLVNTAWRTETSRHTSTQSSSSTLPLASTETCLRVSRTRSYDSPRLWRACNTVALSTRPGSSV
jgi:hypothetical protein